MVGCRKPLTPNVDRNKAPETWITAAPFDTIMLERGVAPQPGTIPIRFHVYWAGSDQDGAVAGYYWAVVETLPISPDGTGKPPLPGPRPRDYHYTTRSDSTFIFTVDQKYPDREHAFFVYSVDDKGKGDPTPARFIFNAQDRFPPLPIFDEAVAIGTVYFFDAGGVLRSEVKTFPVTDIANTSGDLPRDTVPTGSRLRFRFHAQIQVAGSVVKGFRYKLDEAELQPRDGEPLYQKNIIEYHVPPEEADPDRHGADKLVVATGKKTFLLRAVDQANGAQDSTRFFQMNFSPDTWFAGPDPNATGFPWQTLPGTGEKYALLVNGHLPDSGLPGSLLGPDSIQILPVNRTAHRTFLEVYKDSVFLRHEFDTVHLGSWVIIHNGGFDTDSPYAVHVAEGLNDLPGFPGYGPVLTPGPQNGSPVGFRSLITNWAWPSGPLNRTQQSRLYPFFDPNDVLDFWRIGAYHPMTQAGESYSLQRAEDGDGARDERVDDARSAYLSGRPDLRPLVLVFQVDFPPVLETGDVAFRPAEGDTFTSRNWDLRISAADRDPFTSGAAVGGPTESPTLRLRFKVTGKDTDGNPLTFLDPLATGVQQKYVFSGGVLDVNMQVPGNLGSGPCTLTIELCDCTFCELNPGEGRCITKEIHVNYVAPPGPTSTHP